MRVVAILATYNEERFISDCLENLFQQGVEVYLIDNCSTDRTVAIAESYLRRGLIGIENFRRDGVYSWQPILKRKEQLAMTLKADWFMHVDADEIHLPPREDMTINQALAEAERAGYNAIYFSEFTFTPTQESPDHDHPEFQRTMKWYYPFSPIRPQTHLMRAWRSQSVPIGLTQSAGHRLSFPKLNLYPLAFKMRHYLFLSVEHAVRKYVNKPYDPSEVRNGWHGWRASLKQEEIRLPSRVEFRVYTSDDELDSSEPRTQHFIQALATPQARK